MFGKDLKLDDQHLRFIEEIGKIMPGGFFICKANEKEELLYVNPTVLDIFGCATLEEFRELSGNSFKGMVHPEDYDQTVFSALKQIQESEDSVEQVEFRIVRKDGRIRWIENYGRYTDTDAYGGIYYVFINDITDKRERMESDLQVHEAVIEALSESYHTVFLINDVQTESFSLYRGDTQGTTIHGVPIKDALTRMKYTQAKDFYILSTVAEEDQVRLQKELDLKYITERIMEKPQYNVNYLRKMEDGTSRYFRIEFAKVNMPMGKIGIVCGFKDVDEEVREEIEIRKALEEAKRAEEENKRLTEEAQASAKIAELTGSISTLLANMPGLTFSKDVKNGRYLACNQAFAEYAHKPNPEAVVGLTDFEIFDEVTAQHFVDDDRKALEMDEPYIFIEDVPDAIGNPRAFQTTKLKFTDSNGRLCTLGMCVDVTEMMRVKSSEAEGRVRQQELEQRLILQEQLLAQEREKDQQWKMITALASDYRSVYYIELDKDEGICYQSHSELEDSYQAGDHFPYLKTFTDYANNNILETYREDFLNFIQPENIREGLKNELVISFRYVVSRNNEESYEMVRFAGVRHPEDRDDHIVHNVSACFSNVDSETRRTIEQSLALSDALSAAENANKAKTAFLSNMSHEIRTPMNAIIGLNNIALNDSEISEKTRDYLTQIDTSAHHLLSIINDILDMSRIESGRMIIKNEEFSFSKMLEQVNTIISGQCRDKGLNYACQILNHVDDYYIGDDMKLRQILINILGNAVKFTPSGGDVLFTVEEVTRYEERATLRFVMKDTGIGMSEEFLPKIFDTFTQENSASGNKYGSTGLGMAITKSLVELMNGTIEVKSVKGEGSAFTVTVTMNEANHENEEAEDEIHLSDLHVLVIDDDPVATEHAKIVLEQAGVSCECVNSGQEALDVIKVRYGRREMYHLILVDWKMPEMDGVETTRKIREIVGDHTPIIILTSYNWEDIMEEAREAGVDSFVAKPLFASTVMDEFRTAFKNKSEALAQRKISLKGRKILLAEDMQVNAEIMKMVLSMKEMEVDLAENGRVALEMFEMSEEFYYDAILMDMRMPEMDGLEATRAIRALERNDAKQIPIIALTANAFDEDVQRSMQSGLNAHLSKPVEPELLYRTLESLIL